MIFQFRTDRGKTSEVLEILNGGELCQGWGGGAENLDLRHEGFIAKCQEHYDLQTTRVPSNLTWMKEFRDGDILVTPHFPEEGYLSIHYVDQHYPNCYSWREDSNDLNHRIKIRESIGIENRIPIRIPQLREWYGKLQWLRYPIIRIPQFESQFGKVIEESAEGQSFSTDTIARFFEELNDAVLEALTVKLSRIRPSGSDVSFEAVCEKLITAAGYSVVRRNEHDSIGGDVDLRCSRQRDQLSAFSVRSETLLVQIKKHVGETNNEGIDQLLSKLEEEPESEGCVISLGGRFSAEAQEKASENGIALLDKKMVAQLLLKELASVN